MEKPQTNEKTKLIVRLTEPNQKIIHTWPAHEKKTIKSWCEKKIADFEDKEFNELEVKLIRLQRFVGTSRLLGDEEMEDLIEYLTDEFPDMAIDEIDNAVKLAVAGKIIILDGRGREIGAEHFNEFGALYLQRILKPYQNFRGGIIKKYYNAEDAIREAEIKANKPPVTKEEERANRIRLALSNFESFKIDLPTVALHLVYDTLKAEGLMKYDEKRLAQFKQTAIDNVKKEANRGNSAAKSILAILTKQDGDSEASIEWNVKTLAVKAYFTELIKMEAELWHYLKNEIV